MRSVTHFTCASERANPAPTCSQLLPVCCSGVWGPCTTLWTLWLGAYRHLTVVFHLCCRLWYHYILTVMRNNTASRKAGTSHPILTGCPGGSALRNSQNKTNSTGYSSSICALSSVVFPSGFLASNVFLLNQQSCLSSLWLGTRAADWAWNTSALSACSQQLCLPTRACRGKKKLPHLLPESVIRKHILISCMLKAWPQHPSHRRLHSWLDTIPSTTSQARGQVYFWRKQKNS